MDDPKQEQIKYSVLELIVCALIPEGLQLTGSEQNIVKNDVVKFVSNQIKSLPIKTIENQIEVNFNQLFEKN